MTWSNAQAYAQQFGGNLVTIGSSNENDFVSSLLPNTEAWIGLYRIAGSNKNDANSWKWASGASSLYRNWQFGEPNDDLGPNRELWVHLYPIRTWNDAANADLRFGIGELSASPTLFIEPATTNRLIWNGVHSREGYSANQTQTHFFTRM